MIAPRLVPLAFKELVRHRTRTLLTLAGVTVAMFLFTAVQSLQEAVRRATAATAADTTLVVYRQNRFCPATSRLPQRYEGAISDVPGVASVVPVLVVVNNCRAALDVITFRGVPEASVSGAGGMAERWRLLDGDIDSWLRRSDAALVGEVLAVRRGLRVGQSFDSSGVTVTVAGILRSSEPQDQNVAYVHLEFLQQAVGRAAGLGVVTQFTVQVDDPAAIEAVAAAIDERFRSEADPTATRPEKAFVAQAGADMVEILRFTRWLGWGALIMVLALVANAIVLGTQARIRQHAVLRAMGFRSGLVVRLVICESMLLGLMGGVLGAAAALALAHMGNYSLSQEGFSIIVTASWTMLAWGLAISGAVGALAGVLPAFIAGRREVAPSLRAV